MVQEAHHEEDIAQETRLHTLSIELEAERKRVTDLSEAFKAVSR